MDLTAASNVTVVRFRVPQGVDGIEIENSTSIRISEANVTDFTTYPSFLPHGVYVSGSTGVEIEDSRLPNVVSYRSSQVRVLGNNITGHVLITESDRVDAEDNVIGGPAGQYYATLQLFYSTNATIRGNALLRGGFDIEGYRLEDFVSHTLGSDNLVHGKPVRFLMNLSNTTLDATGLGQVLVLNCRDVSVSNAAIEDVEYGLDVAFSRNVTIRDSRIVNTGLVGLFVVRSRELTLFNSTLSGSRYALYLQYVDGALVYRNDFVGNVFDVAGDFSGLQLDYGYPVGGNYWDSYHGVDRCRGSDQNDCAGADGIGDAVHNVTFVGWTLGVDHYPLMSPVHPPQSSETGPPADWTPASLAVIVVACGLVAGLGFLWLRRRKQGRRPGG